MEREGRISNQQLLKAVGQQALQLAVLPQDVTRAALGFAELHEGVRKALERFLSIVWGAERVRAIPILECISVQTDHGTVLIDSAIVRLTERFAGRPNPPDDALGSSPAAPAPADLAPAPASGPRGPTPAPASVRSGRSDRPVAAANPRPVVASPIRSRPGLSRQSSQPARAPARSSSAQPTARTAQSRPVPAAADGTGRAEARENRMSRK